MHTLKKKKWHPYEMQLLQNLREVDPDRRMEFCEWVVNKVNSDTLFPSGILFTDEADFYVNGEVNFQNLRYWSDSSPHWVSPSKMQGVGKTDGVVPDMGRRNCGTCLL
jgi:hypothetical protein